MIDLNPPITGQAAKLTTSRVDDGTTLVCVVHLNAKPVFAECCAVSRDGTQRRIGKSPAGWKIDSASAEAYADGTVRFWLSCYPDGASGTEAAVRYLDFPDAVPPSASVVPPTAAGEVYTPVAGGYVRIFSRTAAESPFAGQATIDLAEKKIPHGITGLHLRVMASAGAASSRVFVGPDANEGAMLACYIQVEGHRTVIESRRPPSPQHTLTVSAPYGALTELFIDVIGMYALS